MKNFLSFLLCFVTASVFAQSLSEKLNLAILQLTTDTNLTAATIGVCVKEVKTNRILVNYNAEKNFVPASLQKLPLTAIALQQLGSRYTFKTYMLTSGTVKDGILNGNLYLVGGGDPTLGSTRFSATHPDVIFEQWSKVIKENGIHTINGNIYFDASFFDSHPLNDAWMWGDVGNYYGAGALGLSWHENMFVVNMVPADSIGRKAMLSSVYPPLPPDILLYNEVNTVKNGVESYLMIYGDSYSKQREICGNIAVNKTQLSAKGALPMPGYVCAWNFKNFLQTKGIRIFDAIYAIDIDSLDTKTDTIYVNHSPSLSVIVNQINKTSNNVYAEAVFKLLGKGSYVGGASAFKAGLTRMGIATNSINIVDGSGLSSVNFISPLALCEVLYDVSTKTYYTQYVHSLSQAGVSGTLRNVLKNKPKGSNIYAKSGTMTGVRAYAGYAINAKGETYCFAIIVNNFTCQSVLVKEKLENILLLLVE
ncbi:MAG: D-alanyl-D-alanine carboxypeptidase/D-alanyl-D-alanine-endopeptidase [Bacteroidales bacterium]|nr:D-alanyl-D-alanine carboxypeptidase/D-alanyl-D-alanine-endopeptidase [Bacteroidales bacterium]MDD4209330.1 D-alanyl-D-alanine carboxypeptidase/D-alanyl-D-alanine-endopeptidase [Bacteroidales bacterium]